VTGYSPAHIIREERGTDSESGNIKKDMMCSHKLTHTHTHSQNTSSAIHHQYGSTKSLF